MSFVVCIMIHVKRRLERNPSCTTKLQGALSKQVKGSQCEVRGGSTCTLSAKELLCCCFHEIQAVPGALRGGLGGMALAGLCSEHLGPEKQSNPVIIAAGTQEMQSVAETTFYRVSKFLLFSINI